MSIEDAIKKGSKDTIRVITAFGETRPAYRWVVDNRAGVASVGVLIKRVDAGWNAEAAITTPPDNQNTLDSGTKYPAFGRRLSIPTWARLSNIPDVILRQWTTRPALTIAATATSRPSPGRSRWPDPHEPPARHEQPTRRAGLPARARPIRSSHWPDPAAGPVTAPPST